VCGETALPSSASWHRPWCRPSRTQVKVCPAVNVWASPLLHLEALSVMESLPAECCKERVQHWLLDGAGMHTRRESGGAGAGAADAGSVFAGAAGSTAAPHTPGYKI